MNDFMTVTVPTTINAANELHLYSKNLRAPSQKPTSPWQRGYLFSKNQQLASVEDALDVDQAVTAAPKPLRKQVEPMFRINIRRRITDTLNSPFEYEMSEAARVVL
jgi:ferric-dicitrate binding protein FerR (iron transport regulator)